MRLTVEFSDEIESKLLKLAARRGERGFSAFVEEAVVRYLEQEEERRRRAEDARSVLGAMDEEDATYLEASVRRRGPWR